MNKLFAVNLEALACAVCKLNDEIALNKYSVVCAADTLPVAPFTAINNSYTLIPFQTAFFNPTDGNFFGGQFTPNRTGFYHVDVRFVYDDNVLFADRIWLQIQGQNGGGDVDSVITNTQYIQMQGSLIVYCQAGLTGIGAYIRLANNGHNLTFTSLAAPKPYGYIYIHYCGDRNAATF